MKTLKVLMLASVMLAVGGFPAARAQIVLPLMPECKSVDHVINVIMANHPNAKNVALPDEVVAGFVSAFDAGESPEARVEADKVLVFMDPAIASFYLEFFKGGCEQGNGAAIAPELFFKYTGGPA